MSRSRKKNEYRRGRAVDASCRCHGSCAWCRQGRLARYLRHLEPGERLRGGPKSRTGDNSHNNDPWGRAPAA